MVSSKRIKGYRTVASGKQIFLANGFIGANLEKTGKFVKEKDLFNLWDYLFIRGKLHLFVQFKTNEAFGKRKLRKWIKPFTDFAKKHSSKYVKYEIWSRWDRKYFKVLDCKTKKIRIEHLKNGKNTRKRVK